VSPDGLTLLLNSNRPGGFGGLDMWITTRASRGSPWASPRNLGPSINTIYSDWIGAISPDGWCYLDDFLGPRPGGLGQEDIWQATITPLVDFKGDGKVYTLHEMQARNSNQLSESFMGFAAKGGRGRETRQ
jgi:hypothetical protein